MRQLIIALLVSLLYLCNMECFGIILQSEIKKRNLQISSGISMGFIFYFALFGLVALPFKLTLAPLRSLSIAWLLILGLSYIVLIIKERDVLTQRLQQIKMNVIKHPLACLCIAILVLLHIIFVLTDANDGLFIDNSYYIGQSATNIYTNTIDQYSAYSGLKLSRLFAKNIYTSWHVHRASIGQIFGLAPLVEANISMTILIIIVSDMLLLKIINFFTSNIKNIIIIYIVAELTIFWNWGYPAVCKWYYWSTFDGKTSVFPFIIIPMYLYIFLLIIKEPDKKGTWVFLLINTLAGNTITMTSSILSIPFLGIFGLVWFGFNRNWRIIPKIIIAMLPSILIVGFYVASSMGYFLRYLPSD